MRLPSESPLRLALPAGRPYGLRPARPPAIPCNGGAVTSGRLQFNA
ncbi:MAG: hypothetical protein LKI57_03240 [Acetobacter lovaniensis]|nr:hypothetical protein [Acetobacter lovaniensis]